MFSSEYCALNTCKKQNTFKFIKYRIVKKFVSSCFSMWIFLYRPSAQRSHFQSMTHGRVSAASCDAYYGRYQ